MDVVADFPHLEYDEFTSKGVPLTGLVLIFQSPVEKRDTSVQRCMSVVSPVSIPSSLLKVDCFHFLCTMYLAGNHLLYVERCTLLELSRAVAAGSLENDGR